VVFPVPEVDAKLAGAEDRLGKLKECIHRGDVTDLLKIGTDRDRQGRVRVRVKELRDVPQEWHVWVGECVHDMRSALDHVAYALNVVGASENPPPCKSQFPIFSRRSGFRAMCRRAHGKAPYECMVRCFPRGARAVVERLQPYHRREDLETAWLEVLAELSNIDKHRHFPLMPVLPGLITYPQQVEGHAVTNHKSIYRPLKLNTTIMWLTVPTLPPSAKEPQVDFRYMGGLNFGGKKADPPLPLILPNEPVDFVLPQILETIRNKVLPAFAPFFEG
jgi:hypothetical protein